MRIILTFMLISVFSFSLINNGVGFSANIADLSPGIEIDSTLVLGSTLTIPNNTWVKTVKAYGVEKILKQLAKCNSVIDTWTAKKAGLEAIVNKYNDLNEVVEKN